MLKMSLILTAFCFDLLLLSSSELISSCTRTMRFWFFTDFCSSRRRESLFRAACRSSSFAFCKRVDRSKSKGYLYYKYRYVHTKDSLKCGFSDVTATSVAYCVKNLWPSNCSKLGNPALHASLESILSNRDSVQEKRLE